MAKFKVGDRVKTLATAATLRLNGSVKYICCQAATKAGGNTCDKKLCIHRAQDYVYVVWANGGTFSYHETELDFDAAHTQQVIGIIPSVHQSPQTPEEKPIKTKTEIAQQILSGFEEAKSQSKFDFDKYNGIYKSKRGQINKSERTAPLEASEINWQEYSYGKRSNHPLN